jgi:alpha-glucosidase
MALLTLRGTPTLYYGEEIGMPDGDIPPDRMQDPFGLRVPGYGLGRDPQRTPMQWDAEPGAGFSHAEPWLPLSQDYQTVNVAAQRADPASTLSLYRRLITLRRETAALVVGSYRSLDGVPSDSYVYVREHEGQRVAVALNFSAQDCALSLPELGGGRVLVSTHMDREEPANLASFVLRDFEGCVVTLAG